VSASGRRLPERLDGPDDVVVRRWVSEDAEALVAAVTESAEHLRPWMPWMAQEPMSVDQRVQMIEDWERDAISKGDVVMGVFVGDRVAGGTGLHRRLGADGLEIGYWIHVGFVRRGLATLVSALLIDAAFALPEIKRVQICHDKANPASGGVPRKLDFRLEHETPAEIEAPGEVGISCCWQITRAEWFGRAPLASRFSLKSG